MTQPQLTRRVLLRLCKAGMLAAPAAWLPACTRGKTLKSSSLYPGTDEQLLDEVERASFDFFWREAGASTGQVKDRALANGHDTRALSSIAATGFGLAAMCIADARGYRNSVDLKERVRTTLRFISSRASTASSITLSTQIPASAWATANCRRSTLRCCCAAH